MVWRDVALGAVGGLVTGWLLGRVGGSAPVAAVAAVAPVAEAGAPARVGVADPAARPDLPQVDLAALVAAQDAQIRQLSEVAFGRPLLWPDGAALALEQEIRATIAECGDDVRLVGTECSEPPCLVTLDLGADSTGKITETCPTMTERLGFRGYSTRQVPCADGSHHNLMVLYVGEHALYRSANPDLEDFSENEGTRMRVRTDDLEETLTCPE